jgi:pyridoxamine 5'-phosphate oxidase
MNRKHEQESENPLISGDLPDGGDPFRLFESWFAEARAREPEDANAMALATVDADGLPNVRMVLLKDFDTDGFVFYTNTGSAKGTELAANMKAAAVLHWKSLRRQVRFRGPVTRVRCLLCDAAAPGADRRLGVAAIASARRSLRIGKGRRGDDGALRRRRGAATTALDGVPHCPHLYRVLGRSPVPPARSAGVLSWGA